MPLSLSIGIDERERDGLLVFLSEIMDDDLDRGRLALCSWRLVGSASAEADQHEEERRDGRKRRVAPAIGWSGRNPICGSGERRNGKLQGVHMSKMGYGEPSKLGTSLTNWLAGAPVAGVDGGLRLAHGVRRAFPIFPGHGRWNISHSSDFDCRVFLRIYDAPATIRSRACRKQGYRRPARRSR